MTFDIYLKPNYSQKPPAEIKFGQPLTLPSIRYSTPSPGINQIASGSQFRCQKAGAASDSLAL